MSRSLLSTAVDILQWLEADAGTPYKVRAERDRAIGKSLDADEQVSALTQVLAWWAAVSNENIDAPQPGERLAALISVATGLLVLFGVLLGMGVAGAVFGYRGDQPVNLFVLLGVLVGLPLIMMVASLLLLKAGALMPGALRDAMGVLNPGRWMGLWLERHLSVNMFETVSHRPLHGSFARWQLMAFGQSFAIGYFMGVLTLAFLLIVFTDLAFGWSTTLATDATFVWQVFHGIALPWSEWLPAAVPDQGLVEASRFYRLEDNTVDAVRAAELGRWWPFVLMTIFVYGLLPRIFLAVLSYWQVRAATRRLLEEGPEITALLDRLRAPRVDFEGQSDDGEVPEQQETAALAQLEITPGSMVIIWNEALAHDQVTKWLSARGAHDAVTIAAAEWQPTSEQREALRRTSKNGAPRPSRLIILTKGWEPPLLAFKDYLALIRDVLGNGPVFVIVPLDISRSEISPADREVWAHALAGLEDPTLYVASAT